MPLRSMVYRHRIPAFAAMASKTRASRNVAACRLRPKSVPRRGEFRLRNPHPDVVRVAAAQQRKAIINRIFRRRSLPPKDRRKPPFPAGGDVSTNLIREFFESSQLAGGNADYVTTGRGREACGDPSAARIAGEKSC